MMTKDEAKVLLLDRVVEYLSTANQRFVYPDYTQQQIKKIVTVSGDLIKKFERELVKTHLKIKKNKEGKE